MMQEAIISFVSLEKQAFSADQQEITKHLTTNYHTEISRNPHLYLIAIPHLHKENITAAGGFVVSIGGSIDAEQFEAKTVDTTHPSDAHTVIECKIDQVLELGESVVVVGRVMHAIVEKVS